MQIKEARTVKFLMSKAEIIENRFGEVQDSREAIYYYLLIGKSDLMDVSEKLQELRVYLNEDGLKHLTCLAKNGQKLSKMQTWFCK